MSAGRIISGVFLVVAVISLVLLLVVNRMVDDTIPDYSGSSASTNISENVEIYRDSVGIAYILAESEKDAIFSLGYLHAQERFFQMDLYRRTASGRLSEIFGAKTKNVDVMFRTIGLKNYVQANYEKLDDYTKSILTVYTKGVNEYLKEKGNKAAIEFDLVNAVPERWSEKDSYLVSKFIGWMLNLSWYTDLAYAHVIQKTGIYKASDIIPDFKHDGKEDYDFLAGKELIAAGFIQSDLEARKLIGFEGTAIGSNNWAVGPAKTVQGKPIIANDPHLPLSLPNFWYTAVIKSKELNAAGVTIPGVPGIVIGNNDNISWVYTNLMADDCDFYYEETDNTGDYYFLDGAWEKMDIRSDTILVKDAPDTVISVKNTHRGPVISGIHSFEYNYGKVDNSSAISIRWSGYEFSNDIGALISINKASDWKEFTAAAEGFKNPGQNFIYADKEGNIGYLAAGNIPARRDNGATIVYDGRTTESDWTGFIDYSDMPKILNPDKNYLATANNKTVADFGFHVTNIWEPESRINRINKLLEQNNSIDAEYLKKMLSDIVTDLPAAVVPHLLESFENLRLTNDNLMDAIELLKQWDYSMHKDDQAPMLFNILRVKLLENILKDELGDVVYKEYVTLTNQPDRLLTELFKDKNNRWFDIQDTPEVEDRDKIVRKSMIDALEFLEKYVSLHVEDWQWNKLHKMKLKHPFSGQWSLLDEIINSEEYEVSGEGTTIYCTGFSYTEPFNVRVGQSMRYIYDFADPGYFYFNMPGGQSGNIMSNHYNDFSEYYLNDKYVKVPVETETIKRSGFDLFTIISVQ